MIEDLLARIRLLRRGQGTEGEQTEGPSPDDSSGEFVDCRPGGLSFGMTAREAARALSAAFGWRCSYCGRFAHGERCSNCGAPLEVGRDG